MDLDMIYQPKDGQQFFPPPLSLKRNEEGFTSEFNLDSHQLLGKAANDCPDGDNVGEYFGSSIRRGPHMLNKQEDRVSRLIQNHFWYFTK